MYKLIEIYSELHDTTYRSVKRLSDGVSIPLDETNIDYLHYLKWLDGYELQGMDWVKTSDGNTPEPADQPE
jgi:hypothetical protein